jgi:hypothetical protein
MGKRSGSAVIDLMVSTIPCPPEHLADWNRGLLIWWSLIEDKEQYLVTADSAMVNKSRRIKNLEVPKFTAFSCQADTMKNTSSSDGFENVA